MTLFPIFSRIQDDDERIALIWLRTVRLTAAVVVPGMAGLVILAPEFVLVVLGAKWEAMVPVIQILACGGIVYALNTIAYGVLLAKGLTGKLFRYSVIGTSMTVCGILAGLGFGVTAVAAGVAAGVVLQWPLYTNGASRALGISMGRYWRNLTPVIVATAAMAAVLIPVRGLLTSSDLRELPVFLACIAVGTAAYVSACWLFGGGLRDDVRLAIGIVKGRLRGEAAAFSPPSSAAPAAPEETPVSFAQP
jgi:O-antigen/teichoic acid export membrane protein